MADSNVEQEEIQEKTEIWKQVIITAGVVIVAVIGAWQAITIVKLNDKPATAAPPAAIPTDAAPTFSGFAPPTFDSRMRTRSPPAVTNTMLRTVWLFNPTSDGQPGE